jgi:hypothetical protein
VLGAPTRGGDSEPDRTLDVLPEKGIRLRPGDSFGEILGGQNLMAVSHHGVC